MKIMQHADTSDPVPLAPTGCKRPYQKPAFRHEWVFETLALACGKISTTQQQCRAVPKSS